MGLPAVPMTAARSRTKKIGCAVRITVKMIAKFPQFKVSFCLFFCVNLLERYIKIANYCVICA